MIFDPSSFPGDPLGWLGNQSAHALIVGCGGFALVAAIWTKRAAAVAVALSYAAWEVWTFQGDTLDAVTDWTFVMCGAAFAWAAWTGNRRDLVVTFAGLMLAAAIGAVIRL